MPGWGASSRGSGWGGSSHHGYGVTQGRGTWESEVRSAHMHGASLRGPRAIYRPKFSQSPLDLNSLNQHGLVPVLGTFPQRVREEADARQRRGSLDDTAREDTATEAGAGQVSGAVQQPSMFSSGHTAAWHPASQVPGSGFQPGVRAQQPVQQSRPAVKPPSRLRTAAANAASNAAPNVTAVVGMLRQEFASWRAAFGAGSGLP